MNKRILFVTVIIASLYFNQAYAGWSDSWVINIGGGFSRAEMTEDFEFYREYDNSYKFGRWAVKRNTNIYSIYGETIYNLKNKLFFGIGFNYVFNGNEINYPINDFLDDYDNRKPRDEDMPDITADIHMMMPYIISGYKFDLVGIALYSRVNIGYGYAGLKDYLVTRGREAYNSHIVGVIPSLGKHFFLNRSFSFNIEFGYRYLKSGKLKSDSGHVNYYNDHLNFSGLFAQSSFSFNL